MAIHNIAVIKHNLLGIYVLEADHATVHAHNRLGTRENVCTILHELVQLLAIPLGHALRSRQIHGNLHRHANLGNGNIRIRCNNRARTLLHTLALNIVAHTPLLGTNTLLKRL